MPAKENKKRSPIVAVMGHVDHGKTTLLDYIKKTGVAGGEAGGITQSIGAYEVTALSGEEITFIDTPGHQAFLAMRAYGTRVADIALLVVAADDGVKEQTKESLKIIKESNTPLIVVINKVDKQGVDIDKAINDLGQEGIFLEGRGGSVSWKSVSAKTGEGIPELLELISLVAEMEELTFNPFDSASGYVIESKLDSRRGPVITLVIKNGTLRVGDHISVNGNNAKIKMMENYKGKRVNSATPSMPVLVLGFGGVPRVGGKFQSLDKTQDSSHNSFFSKKDTQKKEQQPLVDNYSTSANNISDINLVLRASDLGSLEALETIINNICPPENYQVKIIERAVGGINEGAVKTAIASGASIIGFKTKIDKAAETLIKTHSIQVFQSDIIYKLTEQLTEYFEKISKKIKIGELKVLAIFDSKANRQVIGGQVVEGKIVNHSSFIVKRAEKEIGEGKIINLQSEKQDVQELEAPREGGLLIESKTGIKVGDSLVI